MTKAERRIFFKWLRYTGAIAFVLVAICIFAHAGAGMYGLEADVFYNCGTLFFFVWILGLVVSFLFAKFGD